MQKKIENKLLEFKTELEKVKIVKMNNEALYYKLLGAIESTEMLLELEKDERKPKKGK